MVPINFQVKYIHLLKNPKPAGPRGAGEKDRGKSPCRAVCRWPAGDRREIWEVHQQLGGVGNFPTKNEGKTNGFFWGRKTNPDLKMFPHIILNIWTIYFKIWNIFWNQWWRVTWYIGYLIYWQLGAWFQIYTELDDEEKTNNAPSDRNMFSTLSLKHGWKRRLIQWVLNMKFTMVKHRYCLIPGSPRPNKDSPLDYLSRIPWDLEAKFGLWTSWVFIGRKGYPLKTIPIYIEVYHKNHYYFCHIPSLSSRTSILWNHYSRLFWGALSLFAAIKLTFRYNLYWLFTVKMLMKKKQTNKQTNKQTSKQTNKQASKQANKQTNKQASKQTDKQTNKQCNNHI